MNRFLFFCIPLLMLLFTACPTATTSPTTKPTINTFIASPSSLPAGGGSVTLSWDVEDATSLIIDNGIGPVTGTSKIVNVTSDITFTLTATNANGSTTLSTSVTVTAGPDKTPPTVVSVDPADGAKGIKDDASIVITFSEKMNQAATEDAFQRSINFLPADMTYSWNTEGTTLTVKPNDFLEYAAGDDPNIDPITYTFGFTDGAKDLAGNTLEPFNSSFSTLKVIVISLYGIADLDGYVYGGTLGEFNKDSSSILVGNSDSFFKGFFSFDLSSIPAGVIADEAKLIINKEKVLGNPYDILSSITLDHVIYGDSLSEDDYNTPVVADLGIFDSTASTTGYLSSDVTSALNDDLSNRIVRENRSQYRLRFLIEPTEKTAGEIVYFTSSEGPDGQRPFLNIIYYLP